MGSALLVKAVLPGISGLFREGLSGLVSQWRKNLAGAVFLDMIDKLEQFAEPSAGKATVILEPFEVFKGQLVDGKPLRWIFPGAIFAKGHVGVADFRHGLGEFVRVNHLFLFVGFQSEKAQSSFLDFPSMASTFSMW